MVKNLASLGKTVLLTTHYMDEAQHLAHRVAVMAAGRIVAVGAPGSLGLRDDAAVRIRFKPAPGMPIPAGFASLPDGFVEASVDDPVAVLHDITGWAMSHKVALEGLEVVRPNLEDVYLELTESS